MRIRRWSALVPLLMLLLGGFPDAARAQTDSGRIGGTVLDSSNAPVPDADVKVTNEKTGEVRVTKTNAVGFFVVPSLKPSNYTVSIAKSGFSVLEFKELP